MYINAWWRNIIIPTTRYEYYNMLIPPPVNIYSLTKMEMQELFTLEW